MAFERQQRSHSITVVYHHIKNVNLLCVFISYGNFVEQKLLSTIHRASSVHTTILQVTRFPRA